MRIIVVFCLLVLGCFWGPGGVRATTGIKIRQPTITVADVMPTAVPTLAAVKGQNNLTETIGQGEAYRLESILEANKTGKWNVINSFRKAEETAIDRGVSANTIVLLLLLPLIATLVSVLHYGLGLSGYGIFMPTMIAVAFLATGILGGLVLFAMILAISLLSSLVLKRFKLHFWPARSIGLMLISVGTFGLMVSATYLKVLNISNISIFPILFMILLAEEFVRTELAKSKNEAKKLMAGTLVLAMVGAAVMRLRGVQETVLLHPGISLAAGLIVNLTVGNYTGIRWSEIGRFKKAIRQKNIKNLKPKL